ncbi:MAG: dihydroorotate dehydrogenase electron transfer subunit, partial [Fibrobacterota bacterium]
MKKYQRRGIIRKKTEAGPGIFRMSIELPFEENEIKPGQFLFLKPFDGIAPLLRRPFGIASAEDGLLDIIFDVKGGGTLELSKRAEGDELDVIYPLGRGFPLHDGKKPVLVAGGMGIAPLLFLADYLKNKGIEYAFYYGAATSSKLVYAEAACGGASGSGLYTDDGSSGKKGLVTDALAPDSSEVYYCCGPTPMMKAAAKEVIKAGVECYVSLEENMACGVGVCMGCTVDLKPAKDGTRRTARI